jgi:general stress protein 26
LIAEKFNNAKGPAMTERLNDWKKFHDMIKDIKFGMFTHRHEDGRFCAHPMTTQNRQNDREGVLWFFMSRTSDPATGIKADPEVNVSYADPSKDSYVSVSGTARIVEDMARKKELWNAMVKAWFPNGIDDPELALVAVDVTKAEYWDVKSSKLVQLFTMAKAAVTGAPPAGMGEHGTVRTH